MAVEVLLRPDLGKRAYRLKCRFITNPFPNERMLELAKYEAADLFVRDMAKQGWQYTGNGFKMAGPFPKTELVLLPKRSEQEQWHMPSREMLATGHFPRKPLQSKYAAEVPLITETDSWEFELAAVFIRDTILTEVPDLHEE